MQGEPGFELLDFRVLLNGYRRGRASAAATAIVLASSMSALALASSPAHGSASNTRSAGGGAAYLNARLPVQARVSNLLSKLGMSRRTEAAAYAARLAERRRSNPG